MDHFKNIAARNETLAGDTLWPLKLFRAHLVDVSEERQNAIVAKYRRLRDDTTFSSAGPSAHDFRLELYGSLATVEAIADDITKRLSQPDAFAVHREPHGTVTGVMSESLIPLVRLFYDEGYALGEALGPIAAKTKMVGQQVPGDKKAADAVGKQHVAQAFSIIARLSHLESLRDLGNVPDIKYRAVLDGLQNELDRLGFNGIHRMIAANPEMLNRLMQDKSHITVPFSRGQSVKDIPALSDMTRAAYLNAEEAFAREQESSRIFTPSAVQKYIEQSYYFALGDSYAKATSARLDKAEKASTQYDYSLAADFTRPAAEHIATIEQTYAGDGLDAFKAERFLTLKHAALLQDEATERAAAGLKDRIQAAKNTAYGQRVVYDPTKSAPTVKKLPAPKIDEDVDRNSRLYRLGAKAKNLKKRFLGSHTESALQPRDPSERKR